MEGFQFLGCARGEKGSKFWLVKFFPLSCGPCWRRGDPLGWEGPAWSWGSTGGYTGGVTPWSPVQEGRKETQVASFLLQLPWALQPKSRGSSHSHCGSGTGVWKWGSHRSPHSLRVWGRTRYPILQNSKYRHTGCLTHESLMVPVTRVFKQATSLFGADCHRHLQMLTSACPPLPTDSKWSPRSFMSHKKKGTNGTELKERTEWLEESAGLCSESSCGARGRWRERRKGATGQRTVQSLGTRWGGTQVQLNGKQKGN